MWKASVKGTAIHPTVQARYPGVFTSTTLSHLHPPTESLRIFPSLPIPLPLPWFSLSLSPGLQLFPFLQAPLSPQFIIPTGPHLFCHGFPMVNNFNYFVIILPTLDFPGKPGSQCPNKNSSAQSSPPQECPGGTGRGSVILWYGDKAHNGFATQLDLGMTPRVATYL